MFAVCKEFSFEAAHQLVPGCFTAKCSDTVHGHSYKVFVCLASDVTDENGMVLDFGELSEWIDAQKEHLDHSCMLPESMIGAFTRQNPQQKKVVSCSYNPTAENLAYLLYDSLKNYLDSFGTHGRENRKLRVLWVKVHETEKCWALYQPPHPEYIR